jgi:hypothetical protein
MFAILKAFGLRSTLIKISPGSWSRKDEISKEISQDLRA